MMSSESTPSDSVPRQTVVALMQAANAIGGATLTIREEPPLLEMVLTRLAQELPTRAGAIFLHDGQQFTAAAQHHGKGRRAAHLPAIASFVERLLPDMGGATQVLNGDYALEPRDTRDGSATSLREAGIECLLLVPLITRGAPMGAIALELSEALALNPLDTEMLRLIGHLLASGLRERRLQVRLDLANRKLDERPNWQGHNEYTDEQTGLANAEFLNLELERVVSEGVQTGGNVSLLRVEVDRFKAMADAYGPAHTAMVLRQVAQTLQNSIRGRDLAAHLTDDLFFVLLPVTPGIGAVVVAERLRDRLSALSFEVTEGTWHLTASIGVACLSNRVVSVDELFAKSQRCLMQSKSLGGNQVFFDWDEALEVARE